MKAVQLKIGGVAYDGWKSIRVTRSMESISGAFDLSLAEKWRGQIDRWPIYEGDPCEVAIAGITVLTGYIDEREISYSSTDHSLTVSGRDKAGDLVDCSCVLDRWQFSHTSYPDIIRAVCKPFGVKVAVDESLIFPKGPATFAVNPGETAFEVVDRIARLCGCIVISDGIGGIVVTQASKTVSSGAIVYGENVLAGSGTFSAKDRFRRYIVSGQQPGTDDFFGEQAAAIKAEAEDENARDGRVLYVKPEGPVTHAICQRRANWEAVVRSGRSGRVSYTVQGWDQRPGGDLWAPNQLVPVRDPVLNLFTNLLITEVTYTIDDSGGEIAQLSLKRPDAFEQEASTVKQKKIAELTDPWLTAGDFD